MVAHFDYYYNKGDTVNARGVVLIPRTYCSNSKMHDTNTTEDAYANSIIHTTTCPAIASALSTVLGSYLLSNKLLLSSDMKSNIPSMAGANITGASTNYNWMASQCDVPTEIQIYGSTVCSSSFVDVGEATNKLAVFNFINAVEYSRSAFWLRTVVSSVAFAVVASDGGARYGNASVDYPLRPLIYIG